MLVVLGGLWILDLAGTIDVRLAVVLPSFLIVFGLALILGAADGPHSGLVVIGLFLSIAVVIAAAVPVGSFSGGVGERLFRVSEQTALAPTYEVGFGDLRLDLRDLDLAGTIDVRLAVVLPSFLIVFGLALILGAADGPHSGLVVAGLFLSIAVVIAAAVPIGSFSGGVGERLFRVSEQTALAPSYEVGFGDLRLDLRDLDLVEAATVEVTVGAGQITVLLPPSVPVDIKASSVAGQVDLLGERSEGLAVSRDYTSESFDTSEIGLTIVIDVTAGAIEVTR